MSGEQTSSLESRITMPESASNGAAKSTSWADDTDSPAATPKPTTEDDKKELSTSQVDGATVPMHGSELHEPAEYDVQVKLSDIQADPNNPLFSIKSFNELGLSEDILKGIYSMRFQKPSKIQEKALPLLLMNPPKNMIGQSQSGTGKTAAFVLTMLSRLDMTKLSTPQALCLAPSRELARQILGVVQVMGGFMQGMTCEAAIPDMAKRGKNYESQIIVGTPGTVMEAIRRRTLNATELKVLVLDEADNMLDQQGLGDQCIRVRSMLPRTVQVVLFSATFPDKVVNYAQKFAPNANQITLKHEELTVEGIKQVYMDCDSEEHKYEVLVKLYGVMTIGSSIIFVEKRVTADNIEKRMKADGHKVATLHGAYEGRERDAVIDAFRSGQAKVLITTNVLARGIDVQSVSVVVNYDIPRTVTGQPDPQTYLHRIGRTGRFGRVGVSISFVYNKETWTQLTQIQDYFKVNIERIATDDWDVVEETIKKIIKSSRAGTNMIMDQ